MWLETFSKRYRPNKSKGAFDTIFPLIFFVSGVFSQVFEPFRKVFSR